MKVTERNLRRIIRETIEEVSTPRDDRYGMTGDARGGVRGNRGSRGVTFPGSTPEEMETYRQAGRDQERRLAGDAPQSGSDAQQNQQGLSSPGGSYVQGVGWVPSTAAGQAADSADSDISGAGGGLSKDDFFLIIDSQVTRGDEGDIEHVPSGNKFTVQGDRGARGTLIGDLNRAFQMADRKNANQRSRDVIRILMDNDLLEEQDIVDDLISEIGVRGRDTKTIYHIDEYFMEFNNRYIKECRKIMKSILG